MVCSSCKATTTLTCPGCRKGLCAAWTCGVAHSAACVAPRVSLLPLEDAVSLWTRHNFPESTAKDVLLVVVEEGGELARAANRKRGDAGDVAAEAADVLISLLSFCAASSIDLECAVLERWAKVQKRDWVVDPENGGKV